MILRITRCPRATNSHFADDETLPFKEEVASQTKPFRKTGEHIESTSPDAESQQAKAKGKQTLLTGA
jgi:hypothetical protein